jgi:hypothetical protein
VSSSAPGIPTLRLAFLGPAGTFTETAVDGVLSDSRAAVAPEGGEVERVPMATGRSLLRGRPRG